jgi:hypothetical protein
MEKMPMIGCSVMVRGDQTALLNFARQLHIPERNMFRYDQPIQDFSFYDRQENSMQFATLTGDFDFMCDVSLFDVPQDILIDRLRMISASGLVLAIPDDESARPDDCLLFETGSVTKVEVRKDDNLDEVRIVRPTKGVS